MTHDESMNERELPRMLREEIQHMRRAEGQVQEALDRLREARERAERLARALGSRGSLPRIPRPGEQGEEAGAEAAAEAPRKPEGPPRPHVRVADRSRGDGEEEEDDDGGAARNVQLGVVALVSLALVAVVSWMGIMAFTGGVGGNTITLAADSVAEGRPVGRPIDTDSAQDDQARQREVRFFELLPADPKIRAQLYDSLWVARSALFEPLMDDLLDAADDAEVVRQVQAWRTTESLEQPLRRRLHAALVQRAVEVESGRDLSVDGTPIRESCDGEACAALMEVWEMRADTLQLPPAPPRGTALDPEVLRWVERTLLIRRMRGARLGR